MKKIWSFTKNHGTAIGVWLAAIALVLQFITSWSEDRNRSDLLFETIQIREKINTYVNKSNIGLITEKDIVKRRYAGCDIAGRGGKYISSNIEINAPEGYSIVNWKEVPTKENKVIVQSRSNLSNPTFGNGDKFTAKCVGDGKVKRVLGVVVDHYNAWRYSDIILTLKRNKK